MLATSEGVVIRIRIKDISTMGRITQGVKLINLSNEVKVVGVAKIAEEYVEEDETAEVNDENKE